MSNRMTVRAQSSDFTIRLGSATTNGRLIPIRKSRGELYGPEAKLCTPTLGPVSQVYRDNDGNIWNKEDLERGFQQKDGSFIPINADELTQAKESPLPKNVLNLTAHPIEDVERWLFPSDNNAYVFDTMKKEKKGTPVKEDPVNTQWHDFILTILTDGNVALIGQCNFQGNEGLFRLLNYQGNLAIQRQLYPAELNQYDARTPSLSAAVKKKALSVAKNITQEFDPESYRNTAAERIAAVESGDFGTVSSPINDESIELDMLSALDSFVA